jgi:integrase
METTEVLARVPRLPLALERPLPADRNPAAVYLARLAPGSRRTMRQALERIAGLGGEPVAAEAFPWAALRYQHTAALRARLAATFAPSTASKMLAALRGVLRECWRLGLMDAETYQRAADVGGVKGSRLPAGRMLQPRELLALFESCAADGSPGARLDAAVLGLLLGCGLRRSEAAALDLADYDREAGELRVRSGKGNRGRAVPTVNGQRAALDAWLAVRGQEAGAMLCPVDQAGRVTVRRLTSQALYARLARRARAAGVTHFAPHDMRRTFVSGLLEAGADLSTVARLAGHASVSTTVRYDRRDERAQRRAAELLHVPYVRPSA